MVNQGKAPGSSGQDDDEVDFNAALNPPAKRGPGRPRGATAKRPLSINSNNKDILLLDDMRLVDTKQIIDIDISATVNLESDLTVKELKFLEIYLGGKINLQNAMKLAGYQNHTDEYLKKLGSRIVRKYEGQAQDHRKIFRAIGAGEVRVALGLLHLAENARSEMVRLQAWSQISKCLGLSKEILEGAGGLTIIFEAPEAPVPEVGPGPRPASPTTPALPTGRGIMITK